MADNFERVAQTLSKNMNLQKGKIQKTPNLAPRDKQDIKQEIKDFEEKLGELNGLIQSYERNTNKYNLTQNQIQNRKQEYQRLISLKNEISAMIENPNQLKQDLFNKPAEPRTFQNTIAQPGTSTKQMQQGYENLKKDTDNQIDNLIVGVQQTKIIALKMGEEIEDHIEVLDEIDQRIEKNTGEMITTTGKMKKLIQESKTCGILVTIFVEIAILVLIIIYV